MGGTGLESTPVTANCNNELEQSSNRSAAQGAAFRSGPLPETEHAGNFAMAAIAAPAKGSEPRLDALVAILVNRWPSLTERCRREVERLLEGIAE